MPRVKTQKYSKQEIKNASQKVMKSLNLINKKPLKFTPQITNSLARNSALSKSSLRRQNRKKRANLAGKSMDSLLDGLSQVEKKLPQHQPPHQGLLDPHKSSKHNKRVFDNEMSNYKKQVGLSLREIREKLRHGQGNEQAF